MYLNDYFLSREAAIRLREHRRQTRWAASIAELAHARRRRERQRRLAAQQVTERHTVDWRAQRPFLARLLGVRLAGWKYRS